MASHPSIFTQSRDIRENPLRDQTEDLSLQEQFRLDRQERDRQRLIAEEAEQARQAQLAHEEALPQPFGGDRQRRENFFFEQVESNANAPIEEFRAGPVARPGEEQTFKDANELRQEGRNTIRTPKRKRRRGTDVELAIEDAILESAMLAIEEQRKVAAIREQIAGQFPDIFSEAFTGSAVQDPEDFGDLATATPEQKALIGNVIDNAIASGTSDINDFTQSQLRDIRDILAPSRGLRPGDSPIIDRGSLVAQQGVRQIGQLTRGLRGQGAATELTLPFQQNFATEELRGNLAQNAFTNRLQLAGFAGNALGLTNNLNLQEAFSSVQGAGNKRPGNPPFFSSQDQTSLIGSGASLLGAGAVALCHVAAEYYGWFTPDWYAARNWIANGWQGITADVVRGLYRRHGPRVASWVRRSRIVRAALRPVAAWAVRKGLEHE